MRPIKNLEAVEEGVNEFENTMAEYVKAGGPEPPDSELKSDLLRILPREIRELLLWHSTDVGVSFQRFRDTIVAQTAQVLMNRGSHRSINAVDQHETLLKLVKELRENGDGEEGSGDVLDDLVGAIQARRGGFGQRSGNRGTGGGGNGGSGGSARRPGTERGPRMCPNCGGTHAETKCPHP